MSSNELSRATLEKWVSMNMSHLNLPTTQSLEGDIATLDGAIRKSFMSIVNDNSGKEPHVVVDHIPIDANGTMLYIEREVAKTWGTINNILEDCPELAVLPVNTTPELLLKAVEYYYAFKEHQYDEDGDKPKAKITEWEMQFCQMDIPTVIELTKLANFLEAKALLKTLVVYIAKQIEGKSSQQIRETFDIENDFSDEEAILKENSYFEEYIP